jgi:pimeloyl-ACP methyl ester carboxylesterase
LALLRETIDEATASGSKVEKATTIESFLNATKADVVTIVAHSHGGQVELRDGMHAPERIACGFPIEYSGTIDLSTCSSFRLHDAIRERCASLPRIITNRRPVSLGIRIAVYRLTIRLLREHPRPFIDAYAEAWSRLRRSSSQ